MIAWSTDSSTLQAAKDLAVSLKRGNRFPYGVPATSDEVEKVYFSTPGALGLAVGDL